jgi:predicted metal-dependent phosphoesterase TrpH
MCIGQHVAMINRRNLLIGAAAVAGATSVTLDPVSFAEAAPGGTETRTLSGTIKYGAPDWVYIPLQIPRGVNRVTVSYTYDRPAVPAGTNGNALDIGYFDESGIELGNDRGFRGWSGGAKTEFTLSTSDASTGYLPGPIKAGTHHIIVGPYTVAPQGLNWNIAVTLTYGADGPAFVPKHAPRRATGRGKAWYRGDMHLHTVHSDGKRQPSEVAAGARAAGLDYIVSTEHNTSSAAGVWGEFAGPNLLIIDGEEVTTRNGHYTVLGLPAGTWIDWRYRSIDRELPKFVSEIHKTGALAVAAHPQDTCVGCGWKFGYAGLDAIEVWNSTWNAQDEAVLAMWDAMIAAGQFVPAVGDSDAHSEPAVIGLPHTVVYADDLEKSSILAAVKAGRSWIAESAKVNLTFTASTLRHRAGIGERLDAAPDDQVRIDVAVTGEPGATVRLVTDAGMRVSVPLPADGKFTWTTTPQNAAYVRLEVRRPVATTSTPDTMVAFTNPIFLGAAKHGGR